jgi:hypothetical protein
MRMWISSRSTQQSFRNERWEEAASIINNNNNITVNNQLTNQLKQESS